MKLTLLESAWRQTSLRSACGRASKVFVCSHSIDQYTERHPQAPLKVQEGYDMKTRVRTTQIQFVLVIVVSLATATPSLGQTPLSGLVSRWLADGNANDAQNVNNGQLLNGVGFAPGHAGRRLVLTGSTIWC